MNISITVTKILKAGTTVGREAAGDMHLSGDFRLFSGEGANLAVEDPKNGVIYQTDFAFSGVAAKMAAAPGTGGFFLLT